MENVKFRKQLMGGVNEADLWKKINELNRLYQQAFHDQEIYYRALLDEQSRRNRRV
ncbi:hypothetical protein [Globicatella sanguinis]|uniref:hypothetical protein n=1 Tax=Globicatella sanguinis TaxID=13076 RepID=UPI0012EDBCFF|nr:hypothetical protein [Globicatella sanguinis]